MRNVKGQSFSDRIENQNKAKQALIKKMQSAPKPDDPEVIARREAKAAQMAANQAAREKRRAEKEAAEKAEAERIAAEEAAKKYEEERAKREEAEKLVALLDAQKAARDARYAARKARRKGSR